MSSLDLKTTPLREASALNLAFEKCAASSPVTIPRLQSIDFLRGLCMLGMAFCHAREFIGADNYSNMDWHKPAVWQSKSLLDFFQQVFLSSIVACGFFTLMGIGIVFFYKSRLNQGWSSVKITKFLMIRGLLLILIQMTLLQAFESFQRPQPIIYIGVLAALGGCIILSSIVLLFMHWLATNRLTRYIVPLAVALGIIIGLDLFIKNFYSHPSQLNLSHYLFLLSGHYPVNNIDIDVNFTPLPWLPAVMMGFIIAEVIIDKRQEAYAFLFKLGVVFITCFFILRILQQYHFISFGEYKLSPVVLNFNLKDLFCFSKYPPSLCYYLWAMGITLILLSAASTLIKKPSSKLFFIKFITLLGKCALLFFVLHWFVYLAISLLIGFKTVSLVGILSFWLAGIVILFPLCYFYNQFKSKQHIDSLWRFF